MEVIQSKIEEGTSAWSVLHADATRVVDIDLS